MPTAVGRGIADDLVDPPLAPHVGLRQQPIQPLPKISRLFWQFNPKGTSAKTQAEGPAFLPFQQP
jgi:hypothetical protein